MLAHLAEARDRIALGWTRTVSGLRGYRFAGEQANHADQLRETQASLATFEAVAANPEATAEQRYWLNAHRVGMEDRLSVMERLPRLTREQLNERDAIETHLYGAPLPRGRLQPLLGTGAMAIGALGGVRLWMVLAAGMALTTGATALQTWRLNHAKDDLRETRETLARAVQERDDWQARAGLYAQAVTDARETAQASAAALEAERRRQAQAARRERERQRAIQNVLTDSPEPPAWRLRDDEPVSEQPGPSD